MSKKTVKPSQRKALAHYAVNSFGLGVVLACDALGISRCSFYYQTKRIDDSEIVTILTDLAEQYPRYGFRKLFKRLRNLDHPWNHKRVYRVYCGLKLNLRRREGKKRLPSRHPERLAVPAKANDSWSMDFMSDSLYLGRSFRTFNVIDEKVNCRRQEIPPWGVTTGNHSLLRLIPVYRQNASFEYWTG